MTSFRKHKRMLPVLSLVFAAGVLLDIGNAVGAYADKKISQRTLKEMIGGAKTAADHKAIADYYYSEAAKARAKADEHEQEAALYRRAGEATKKIPYAPETIAHCEALVKNYRTAADNFTALAKEHESMAAKIK
jgi:hypothetical protein